MFEQAMGATRRGQKVNRHWIILAVALTFHTAGVGAVVFASVWNIDAVAEPVTSDTLFIPVGLPAPPPPPPPRRAAPTPTAVEPEPVPQDVQPTSVEPQVVEPTPAAGVNDPFATPDGSDRGRAGGVDGGVDDGVDGSVPDQPASAATPPPAAQGPLPVGGEVMAPVAIHRVEPLYPPMARRAGITGVVVLRAVIDREGRVRDVAVLRGGAMGLDEAARAALVQWRFRPGTLHGRPVDVAYTLTINFQIAGRGRG
jgi:protein TonB